MVVGSVVPLTIIIVAPKLQRRGLVFFGEIGYYCAVMIGYNLGVIMG